MTSLIKYTFRSTPAVLRILPRALYHPEVNPTNKGEEFFITSSYPDDVEPPTITKKRTVVQTTREWEELNATQSEADVKADRDEVRAAKAAQAEQKKGTPDDAFEPEPPKIDEM